MAAKDGSATLVAVMGSPISHSLSPLIHEYWIREYGLNAAYIPLYVPPTLFSDALDVYVKTGFKGFNVTLPHKQAAYAHNAIVCDAKADLCGAVNTIYTDNKTLRGTNTDIYGFKKLFEHAGGAQLPTNTPILILGAGGAARAVLAALFDNESSCITIANRTPSNATDMLDALSKHQNYVACDVISSNELKQAKYNFGIVINTLSVNAIHTIDTETLVKTSTEDALFIDISYGVNGTNFTRAIKELSYNHVYEGLEMLLWQAVPGFEHWFGVKPKVDDILREHVSAAIKT